MRTSNDSEGVVASEHYKSGTRAVVLATSRELSNNKRISDKLTATELFSV